METEKLEKELFEIIRKFDIPQHRKNIDTGGCTRTSARKILTK